MSERAFLVVNFDLPRKDAKSYRHRASVKIPSGVSAADLIEQLQDLTNEFDNVSVEVGPPKRLN